MKNRVTKLHKLLFVTFFSINIAIAESIQKIPLNSPQNTPKSPAASQNIKPIKNSFISKNSQYSDFLNAAKLYDFSLGEFSEDFKQNIFKNTQNTTQNALQNKKDSAKSSTKKLTNKQKKELEKLQTERDKVLQNVTQKLKDKKDLRIRIFGDSHIASDFFADELRHILQSDTKSNTNAIGFAYPLQPPFHQNMLLDYTQENFNVLDIRNSLKELENLPLHKPITFPLGGVIAYPKQPSEISNDPSSEISTKDANRLPSEIPAKITLNLNPKANIKNTQFSVQIIFKNDAASDVFSILDSKNNEYILKAKKANEWQIEKLNLYFPVSITALSQKAMLGGYFIYNEENLQDSKADSKTQNVTNRNNIIESIGLNGVRSDIWLRWDKEILKQELGLLNYDILILSYGSNDAMYDVFNEEKFIKNYSDFIALLREFNKDSMIILLSPPLVSKQTKKTQIVNKKKKTITTYELTKNYWQVVNAVKKVAIKNKTYLFDMQEFIADNGTKSAWVEKNLSKEDVHLTPQGYFIVADGLYMGLLGALKMSQ